MGDLLFSVVEKFNGGRDWGKFLDAGTGAHSLRWIQTLNTIGWTAITADDQMKRNIMNDPVINVRSCDSLVVGNWMDEDFCATLGKFDTILADYLIGAVDGFSPYEQDRIVEKLSNHLNPGGKLFVIGMNPIPDHASPPADLIGEVRRARDSCILMAGHRPYREFPLSWMKRHLEKANFKVIKSKNFTILHSDESITRQIRVASSKLPLMPYAVRAGTEQYLNELQAKVSAALKTAKSNRIPLSFDYVIHAEYAPPGSAPSTTAFSMQADDENIEAVSAQVSDALILEALESLSEEDIVEMQSAPV